MSGLIDEKLLQKFLKQNRSKTISFRYDSAKSGNAEMWRTLILLDYDHEHFWCKDGEERITCYCVERVLELRNRIDERKKRIMLVSKWQNSDLQIDTLRELCNYEDFLGKKVFYCYTATRQFGDYAEWAYRDAMSQSGLGFTFDPCDINNAKLDEVVERMSAADILFFQGGSTPALFEAIKKTGLLPHFKKLLKTKIYIGVSAGGCVLSPYLFDTCDKWFIDNGTPRKGLSIIDFVFIPHFGSEDYAENNEKNLRNVKKHLAKCQVEAKLIGDDSLIVITDKKVKILGNGGRSLK